MVDAQGLGSNDSWVRRNFMFGLVKGVLVSGYEKALVVRATVAKHNLRRVLIGHDDRRSRQTAAVGKRVIHFERFLHHASV